MPYIPGSGGITDVYNSNNVFINNVPVALWLSPIPGQGIALPEINTVTYNQLSTSTQEAIVSSATEANTSAEAEVGLTGKGTVPQEGPLTLASSNADSASGVADSSTTSTFTITTSTGIFIEIAKNIDACLNDASQGLWKENGGNTRILDCYKSVGFNFTNDQTPWCAAFVGTILKSSGAAAFKTLSSLAYQTYGQSVPLNDKSQWRLNDIVVFSRAGGGHVGFFRGYNPTTGSVLIAGGNQSDNLNETGFRAGGLPIIYVGRGWEIPNEYDRPVTYSGVGSASVKVV
jgi:uncharacterized protein (TIGR02594 family)